MVDTVVVAGLTTDLVDVNWQVDSFLAGSVLVYPRRLLVLSFVACAGLRMAEALVEDWTSSSWRGMSSNWRSFSEGLESCRMSFVGSRLQGKI